MKQILCYVWVILSFHPSAKKSLGPANLYGPQDSHKTTAGPKAEDYDYVIEKSDGAYCAKSKTGENYTAATFNRALAAALRQLSSGGRILVKEGRYDNLDPIEIPYDNITLEGEGMYSTILKLKAKADVGVAGFAAGKFLSSDRHNTVIRNLQLDGNFSNQTKIDSNASVETAVWVGVALGGRNALLQRCFIKDFTLYGVYSWGSYNSVEYCIFKDNAWNGITLDSSMNKALYNVVSGGGDVGISAYGSHHLVEGNYVFDVDGAHGAVGTMVGIAIEQAGEQPSHGSVIRNNRITGAKMKRGIASYVIKTDPAKAENSVIEDNIVYDINGAGAIGIDIEHGRKCTIRGNVVRNVKQHGIRIYRSHSNLVEYNRVTDIGSSDAAFGLIVEAYTAGFADSNTIRYNYLSAYSAGLYINRRGLKNIVTGNIIEGKTVTDLYDEGTATKRSRNYNLSGACLEGIHGLLPNRRAVVAKADRKIDRLTYQRYDPELEVSVEQGGTYRLEGIVFFDIEASAAGLWDRAGAVDLIALHGQKRINVLHKNSSDTLCCTNDGSGTSVLPSPQEMTITSGYSYTKFDMVVTTRSAGSFSVHLATKKPDSPGGLWRCKGSFVELSKN